MLVSYTLVFHQRLSPIPQSISDYAHLESECSAKDGSQHLPVSSEEGAENKMVSFIGLVAAKVEGW